MLGALNRAVSARGTDGRVLACELASDFRAWMRARVEVESLRNVSVWPATAQDPLGGYTGADVDVAVLCDGGLRRGGTNSLSLTSHRPAKMRSSTLLNQSITTSSSPERPAVRFVRKCALLDGL